MATVEDIVNRALKRAGVLDAIETASADDAQYALDSLNEMMAGWQAKGVDVNHNTLTLVSTFPLDDMHQAGVIALLAAELADDYGQPVSQRLSEAATAGWRALEADYCLPEPMRVDGSLAFTPSQRRWHV